MMTLMVCALAITGACSSGSDGPVDVAAPDEPSTPEPVIAEPTATAATPIPATTTPVVEPTTEETPEETAAPTIELSTPTVEGNGVRAPLASAPLPDGYLEQEFFIGGEAASYETVDATSGDGFWTAQLAESAPYRTRLIVRRPPADRFSGTVLVEWMNVTAGHDTTPDWGYLHEMIGREGHAYVAVSAQAVGLNGRDGDFIGGGLVDTSGLIAIDPERYGDLTHPGDAYAYDIFTQAGEAIRNLDILGGLEPDHLLALGESQSAFFMTTYINAVHPLAQEFDGFLVHSRGGSAPSVEAIRDNDSPPIKIRTDLDEPTLIYVTETDLFGLSYIGARQDDTSRVVTWEVAGTAHADAYSLAANGLPRSATIGSFIGCETPINDGPQHETLAAAVHHLIRWVADDISPPDGPLLATDGDAITRDEYGVAIGGIRTPVVDAPTRALSGDPGPDGGACFLFGQTLTIPADALAERYGQPSTYADEVQRAAGDAVTQGWLLEPDAVNMIEEELARGADLDLTG